LLGEIHVVHAESVTGSDSIANTKSGVAHSL
jgi:hypothetical protein